MTVEVQLVTGSTGAGKTTYALELAAREGALRLSIDEWMTTLFGPDLPTPLQFGWMMDRVYRCEAQMWAVALQAVARGTPIVVDCGLTRESHRCKWTKLAADAGLPVRLHHLDVDPKSVGGASRAATSSAAPPTASRSPARCSTWWRRSGSGPATMSLGA